LPGNSKRRIPKIYLPLVSTAKLLQATRKETQGREFPLRIFKWRIPKIYYPAVSAAKLLQASRKGTQRREFPRRII
jgi:hypothetical protein